MKELIMESQGLVGMFLLDVQAGVSEEVSSEREADKLAKDWARDGFENYEIEVGNIYLAKEDAVLFTYFSRQRALDSRSSYAVTRAIQDDNTVLMELYAGSPDDDAPELIKSYTECAMIESLYKREIASFENSWKRYFNYLQDEYGYSGYDRT